MCDLTKSVSDEFINGYKIVALDPETGKKYSLAMGFCYDDLPDGKVPVVEEQEQIGHFYTNNILDANLVSPFQRGMVGRSAVFINLEDVLKVKGSTVGFHREIITKQKGGCFFTDYKKKKKYKYTIFTATVSEDILIGTYECCQVAAGRNIKLWEERDHGIN